MTPFKPTDRGTLYLLPPSLEDWLPEDHLARFVVEVVGKLNLSAITGAYQNGGSLAYHPAMLLSLLFYGYATGVYSSRKIEQATYDSIAFRYLAGNEHPDHDTLATFRRRFLVEIRTLFTQTLVLAHEMKLLKVGLVALDGTKVHANASRHSALSWGHATKLEVQLKAEVAELLRLAEQADQSREPTGFSLPDELQRRQDRLAVLERAKATIDARAKQRFEKERADHEATVAKRREKEKRTGRKAKGDEPKPPQPGPRPKDQVNLTDEESRIMPVSGGGFEQAYNAQAIVAEDSLLVLTTDVTQAPNDKEQIAPALEQLVHLTPLLGRADALLADAGYFSAANVEAVETAQIMPLISPGREPHHPHWRERFKEPEGDPVDDTPVGRMRHRLKTLAGRALYAKRKHTVEPVFGIIKHAMRFRQFLLRGLEKVTGEWNLVCLAWNLRRMAVLRGA
jgi:transposase